MKRILAFMLAFVMLLGTIPTAYATEAEELPVEIPVAEEPAPETEPVTEAAVPDTQAAGIASGTAGSLTWEITEDYVLKITGNGAIPDYEYNEAPWSEYSWDVTSLELNEGITRIGNWAFAHFILETTPVIPESVTSIGDYAFRACNSMDGLKLPKSLASLGEYALSDTSLTDITIPAGITDLPAGIFYNCRQLSKVELPANLKTVGIQAFAYCVALETIDLPAGVTTLDEFAFAESGLKTIELPDSITQIGGDAFRNCTALESITLPSNLTVLNGGVFAQTHSLKAITIPDSVKIIRGAFTQSEGLTEITIPASVEYMTGSTFAYCPNLQSVVFEGDLPMEEDEYSQPLGMAFLGTTTTVYYIDGNPTWDAVVGKNCGGQITWVAYPCDHPAMTLVPAKESTCTEQGYPAHYSCGKCHKLFMEDGVTQTTLEEILLPLADHDYKDGVCTACGAIPFTYEIYRDMNDEAYIAIWSYTGDDTELVIPAYIDGVPVTTLVYSFLNEEQRAKITAIQLPETMKDIGSALCMCKALKEITIPAGVTELEYQAFSGCSSLEKVIFKGAMTEIGESAFSNCSGLKEITLPQGITTIPQYAFYNCSALTKVVLPVGVTTIDDNAFWKCGSLADIDFPNTLTAIGRDAFSDCASLVSVRLPESITVIGDGAFEYCTALEEINIPSALTEIPNWIFMNCSSLKSIDLPDGITSIGDFALSGCSSLTEIIIPTSVTKIGTAAFGTCTGLVSVEVPDSVTELGTGVFQACTGLKEVTLPSGLTTIPSGLFISCSALEAVDLPVGVTKIETNAFLWCESLQYVSLPLALTEIEGTTFNRCPALKCIRYAGTKEDRDKIVIGVSNDVLNDANWHYENTCCTPEIKVTLDESTQKPLISWDAKPCLGSYVICRGETPNTVTEELGMTEGDSWLDETAPHNGYYYTVTGIARDEITAATSSPANLDGKLVAPKLTGETVPYSGKPVISWNSVYGAVKYEVYRATSATGKYSKVKTTTETTYLDSSAAAAKTYFYKVKAIAKSSSKNGPLSDYVSVPCLCAQPDVTYKLDPATGAPVLSWNKVSGAVKYQIWRASEDSEGYHDIVSTQTGTTFKDVTAPADQDCCYVLIAIASNTYYNSVIPDLDDHLVIHSGIGQPVVTAASDDATGLPILTWQAVDGANEYEISRSTKSGGTYEVIGTTGELNFVDEAAEAGKTNYYKVTAISAKGTRSAESSYKAASCNCQEPVIAVILDNASGKPQIRWNAVDGAKKYNVYRATAENGKYSKIKTVTTPEYLDTGASVGKTYFYKVVAVASSTSYNSNYSNIGSCYAVCAQPVVTAKLIAATGQPELSWKKVTGASQYQILRATEVDGEYEVLVTQKTTSYKDTNVVVDTEYFYKVNAIATNAANNSVDATPVAITASVAQPAIKTTASDAATGKPVLTWTAIAGAAEYEVSRSVKSNGTYESVGVTAELTFRDNSAEGGKTYYYKVTAITAQGTRSVVSAYKTAKCICAAPTITVQMDTATGKPQITWNAVDGAKKYEVYRATTENGKYSKTKTVTTTSYIDTGASVGKTYFYKVKAAASSSSYNSDFSNVGCSYVICAQPVVTVKISNKGMPELSWKKVTGASQYQILRAADMDGQYEVLATQKTTSYKPADQAFDVAYFYKVNAIAANADNNSLDAAPIMVAVSCAQPVIKTAVSDPATGKPVLTWNAVENAVSYEISRSTSKSGTYAAVGTTDEVTFRDESAEVGKTYYYKLTALGNNSRSLASAYKSVKCKCAAPVAAVTANENGKPQISWEIVDGAKKYEVYRATSEKGKYSKVGTTSDLTYTDAKASAGKTYFYKVKAVASSSSYSSDYSQIVSFVP